jgi:hypothetical protein
VRVAKKRAMWSADFMTTNTVYVAIAIDVLKNRLGHAETA